jgi:toxin HigB-1
MSKKFPGSIQKAALRRLWILDAAGTLEDLQSPPGNRLESLKGARQGQYSMRINNQFRLCFIWQENNAYEVEIVDYH